MTKYLLAMKHIGIYAFNSFEARKRMITQCKAKQIDYATSIIEDDEE